MQRNDRRGRAKEKEWARINVKWASEKSTDRERKTAEVKEGTKSFH